MNQYPVRRFSITFLPEYERVDSQGRVVGHYRLPISVMEQPRLKELLQQALDDYGLIIQNQRIDSSTDHVIVEVTTEPIFYEYYGTTNLTADDFRTYMLGQFNTETKEDTWKGGDLSFQIVDPATGKTVTSYLDLFVDQVTELPVTPSVTPTPMSLSGIPVNPIVRPSLTFGAITATSRSANIKIPGQGYALNSPTSGLTSPSRSGKSPPIVLPLPPATTLPQYPNRLSQGGYIARAELPAAITQLAQSARVIEYKQVKKDGSTAHYYLFKPANDKYFVVKIKFDRSGRPQDQVELVYGMADPAANPKLKLVRGIMAKEGLSVLRQLAGRYPHLLGMIDSVQL